MKPANEEVSLPPIITELCPGELGFARQPQSETKVRESELTRTSRRILASPLVRKMAKQFNIDLGGVPGRGVHGRITKDDVAAFLRRRRNVARDAQLDTLFAGSLTDTNMHHEHQPPSPPGALVAMSPMRKKIAERMVESKRISPHVHTVYEVDMTPIVRMRSLARAEWEQRNETRLTFMPFIACATVAAIQRHPIVNASVEGNNIRYHANVNLGIAVALAWGLIVPVIKRAEELSFLGMQRAINDLGERARQKQLHPNDVAGGTFTVTNPGPIGGLFGMPIIMQPQVAILGIGGIRLTPTVLIDTNGGESIAVRSIMSIVLGYDNRIVDTTVAGNFLASVKGFLEKWSEDIG